MPDDPRGFPNPPGGTTAGTAGKSQSWTPPTPEELQRLLPPYEVISLLGCGGMGAVYRARQLSLDRPVAIKILPPQDGGDTEFAERFKNEARSMARMNHPCIVGVYDFGETADGQLYLVIEFIDGTDVAQMILANGKLPPDHALAIAAHVCDALHYAHSHGVIHRDIKPANVLINREGQVKVCDFGLAKATDRAALGITRTNVAMGTPDFVAPEALITGMEVDHRADLYSLGVTLYHMLTGEVPRGMFKLPSQKVGADARFDAIIRRAMESDVGDRYQSARDIRADLDQILCTPMTPSESAPGAPQVAGTGTTRNRPVMKQSRPVTARAKSVTASSQPVLNRGTGAPGSSTVPPGPSPAKGVPHKVVVQQLSAGHAASPAAIPASVPMCAGAIAPTSADYDPGLSEGAIPPRKSQAVMVSAVAAGIAVMAAIGWFVLGAAKTPAASAASPSAPGLKAAEAKPAPVVVIDQSPWKREAQANRGHRYQVFEERTSWTEAKARAEKLGGHLATITAKPEADFIRKNYLGGPGTQFWIGGHADDNGQWTWVTGEAWNFEEWGEHKTRGKYPYRLRASGPISDSCLEYVWDESSIAPGGWANASDRSQGPARCGYLVEWDDLGVPLQTLIFRGHRYQLFPEVVGWDEAREAAEKLGGHLATLAKKEENEWVLLTFGKLLALGNTTVFLGGIQKDEKSGWQWVTGETWSYEAWSPGQPDHKNTGYPFIVKFLRGPKIGWDDAPARGSKGMYLVEWDNDGKPKPESKPVVAAISPGPPAARASAPGKVEDPAPPPTPPASQSPARSFPEVEKRLAEIAQQFQNAFDRDVQKAHDASVAALDAKYVAALDRAQDAASKAGRPGEVTSLREEKQRLEGRQPLPLNDADSLPESLRQLRGTYRAALGKLESDRDAKARPYYDRYHQLLESYENELGQQQKNEEALVVKAKRDEIASRRGGK